MGLRFSGSSRYWLQAYSRGFCSLCLRKLGAEPVDWVAHPLPMQVAFWILAVALVCFFAIRFAPRAGRLGLVGGRLDLLGASWEYFWLRACATAELYFAGRDGRSLRWPRSAFVFRARELEDADSRWLRLFRSRRSRSCSSERCCCSTRASEIPILPALSILLAFLLTPIAPLCAGFGPSPAIAAHRVAWIGHRGNARLPRFLRWWRRRFQRNRPST